jgi:hypothetical protein
MTDVAAVTPAISQIVAPVIMISACGLFAATIYGRLAAVTGRTRDMQRARLTEIERFAKIPLENRELEVTQVSRIFLDDLVKEIPRLLIRASIMTASLILLLLCLMNMIACSLVLAFAVQFPMLVLGESLPVSLFILGAICMFLATVLAVPELILGITSIFKQNEFIQRVQDLEVRWLLDEQSIKHRSLDRVPMLQPRSAGSSVDLTRISLSLGGGAGGGSSHV